MTKICGLINTRDNKTANKERLFLMAKCIRHTSETIDDHVHFVDGGIVVTKNSEYDKSQSVWSSDHVSCLTLCGDIVDSKDRIISEYEVDPAIRNFDDATFLLHAFEKYGNDILDKLNGVFCFVYYNSEKRLLIIANDRYGIMPLYYYYDETTLIFSSEVKAIFTVLERQEIAWEQCADFFYIGHMMGNKTLFKNIYAFEPGQVLTHYNNKLELRTYYDFTRTPVLSDDEISIDKIAGLFVEAVRSRVKNGTPNTVLLSGGGDSRFVLGALRTLNIVPNIVSLEHASENEGADGNYAAAVAKSLGLEYDFRRTRKHFFSSKDWLEVFYILDGMIPNFNLFITEIYPELDRSLGVVWDGFFLDVVLGGSYQSEAGAEKDVKKLISQRRINRILLRLILTPQHFHTMDNTFMQRLHNKLSSIPVSENQFLHFLIKQRGRRRAASHLYQLFATKVEIMAPSTDIDFMDYIMAVPTRMKLNHKIYFDVLSKHFPFVTKIPIYSGGKTLFHFSDGRAKGEPIKRSGVIHVSERILLTLKALQGYVFRRYIYGGNHEIENNEKRLFIIEILDKKSFDRPFYNKKVLRHLYKAYRNGNTLYHRLFVIIFYIELWHLLFVDKDSSILFDPRNFRAE